MNNKTFKALESEIHHEYLVCELTEDFGEEPFVCKKGDTILLGGNWKNCIDVEQKIQIVIPIKILNFKKKVLLKHLNTTHQMVEQFLKAE